MDPERAEIEAAIEALKSGKVIEAIDIYKGLTLRPPSQEETLNKAILEEVFTSMGVDPHNYQSDESDDEEESSCLRVGKEDPLKEMERQHLMSLEKQKSESERRRFEDLEALKRVNKELDDLRKPKWGDTPLNEGDQGEALQAPKDLEHSGKEESDDEKSVEMPPLEDVEDLTRVVTGDFLSLMKMIGSLGITLTPDEERPLLAKFKAINGLCVRDVIMYLEGSRTRGTLSEAKMSSLVDENRSLTQTLVTQTRVMERFLSEMREHERAHAQALEERVNRKEKKLQEREKIIDELERSVKKKMEEVSRSIKPPKPSAYTTLSSPSVLSTTSSRERSKKKTLTSQEIQAAINRATEKTVFLGPCTGLLTLCMDIQKTPEEYAEFYGVTIHQINELMEDMPETAAGMKKKYGSVRETTKELHVRLRSKYPIGSE